MVPLMRAEGPIVCAVEMVLASHRYPRSLSVAPIILQQFVSVIMVEKETTDSIKE